MEQEELVMILAVVAAVVVIMAALIVGLWLHFGREITYEEAMASKVMQGDHKEKVSTAKKLKKRKKKKSDSEDEETSAQLRNKPILKVDARKTELSKAVGFDVQTPLPKKTERPAFSPPTPHPAAMDPVHYASLLGSTEDDEMMPGNDIDTEKEQSPAEGSHASVSVPKQEPTVTKELPVFNNDVTPAPTKKAKTKKRLAADYGRVILLYALC